VSTFHLHLFIIYFLYYSRYEQTKRTNNHVNPSAEDIHKLGELFTKDVYKSLLQAFPSWMQSLENLYPTNIPREYGRIGDTPFSHMGITKNYWITPHKNLGDSYMGFIMWFTKGNFLYI